MNRETEAEPRAAWIAGLPLVLGAVLALTVLTYWAGLQKTKFDEVALGAETTSIFPRDEGIPIHCGTFAAGDECFNAYRQQRDAGDAVLWLGNSQLHAINQYRPGDENGSLLLHRALRPSHLWAVTYSQPNASLEEHYLGYKYLRPRYMPVAFVLPVVYDDLRESGIRDDLLSLFDDSGVVADLRKDEVGRSLWDNYGSKDAAGNDLAGLKDTVQERSERYFNDWLDTNWGLWQIRADLRGSFFLGLYKLRNWLFGIDPSSVRKMIPGRYKANMAAYEAMLADAAAHNISVLVYIVPLRRDVAPPYDMAAYAKFKQDVEARAVAYGAAFADLDELVPGKYWGSKAATGLGGGGGELDFMHFQAPGHRLLADKLGHILLAQRSKGAGGS